jgi:hypothetical protein
MVTGAPALTFGKLREYCRSEIPCFARTAGPGNTLCRASFVFRDGTASPPRKPIGSTGFLASEAGAADREQGALPSRPAVAATETNLTVHTRDLRRSDRKRVLMRATLIAATGAQEVRIKDLTSEGAGVSTAVPLERGSDVILKRGDLFIAARVVWVEGTTAGLEFYRPLDSADTAFMLGA